MKISDFSISDSLSAHSPPSLDTLRYCAPETLHSARSPTERGDVYACALLFYEMMTCEVPFGDVRTCEELFGKVTSGEIFGSDFPYFLSSMKGDRPRLRRPKEPFTSQKSGIHELIILGWSPNASLRPQSSRILNEIRSIQKTIAAD